MTIVGGRVEVDHTVVQERVVEHGGIVIVIDLPSRDSLLLSVLVDEDHENIRNTRYGYLGGIKNNFLQTVHLLTDKAYFFAGQTGDHILRKIKVPDFDLILLDTLQHFDKHLGTKRRISEPQALQILKI